MAVKGQVKDLTGERFGRLVVLGLDHINQHGTSYWRCRCDCGNEKVVQRGNLMTGTTTSCGCFAREDASRRNRKHGGRDTRLYGVWKNIKRRCLNPADPSYPNYGGRGITICEEWKSDFAAFQEWALKAGYEETDAFSIDRIDNNGDYTPENCRWVDMRVQSNNRRSNRNITYNGVTKTISEWAQFLQVSKVTLRWRLDRCNDDLALACSLPMNYHDWSNAFHPRQFKPRQVKAPAPKEALYSLWRSYKNRCYNSNDVKYPTHGARGITMCDEWKDSYTAFRDWSLANGYKEKQGLVLHRIDPAGPYSPLNCRWTTRSDHCTTDTRWATLVTYRGKTQNLKQWASELGITPTTLMYRLTNYDWDAEKAFNHRKGTRIR